MRKKTDEIEGVLIGSWRGVEKYSCRLCAYDTLEKQKFLDHFKAAHPPLEVIEGFKPAEPEPLETPVEE